MAITFVTNCTQINHKDHYSPFCSSKAFTNEEDLYWSSLATVLSRFLLFDIVTKEPTTKNCTGMSAGLEKQRR